MHGMYYEKKVLCSAEKSSVIWAEPHSRNSAEPNVRSVTTLVKKFTKQSNGFLTADSIFLCFYCKSILSNKTKNKSPYIFFFSPNKFQIKFPPTLLFGTPVVFGTLEYIVIA